VYSQTTLRLTMPATLQDARLATERIVTLCERFEAEDRALYSTAVMELLVNVVKHGYMSALGAVVAIYVDLTPDSIKLVIEDTGLGMLPGQLTAAPSELNFDVADLSRLPESGMGLAIVKSVMDTVRYETQFGVNRLTAIKRWTR
jgi:serine/threonine-protein kinase RsbW